MMLRIFTSFSESVFLLILTFFQFESSVLENLAADQRLLNQANTFRNSPGASRVIIANFCTHCNINILNSNISSNWNLN